MEQKVYLVHALSPLHAGTGQGVGVIDLPIARDVATKLPIVPGSSIKGCLRSWFADRAEISKDKLLAVFGPKTENASDYAGAAVFGDARLLCLPVRSMKGVFAWVSSPMVLHRFRRDISGTETDLPDLRFAEGKSAMSADAVVVGGKVYLEDLDLDVGAAVGSDATAWAIKISSMLYPDGLVDADLFRAEFRRRFLVVTDDVFNFLYENAVEVNARIRISDESKTVERGALWYEEALPTESVLWGNVVAEKPHKYRVEKAKGSAGNPDETMKVPSDVLAFLFPNDLYRSVLQFGGKATTGRGRVRLIG